jgi:hypothetical protein
MIVRYQYQGAYLQAVCEVTTTAGACGTSADLHQYIRDVT